MKAITFWGCSVWLAMLRASRCVDHLVLLVGFRMPGLCTARVRHIDFNR